MKMPANSAPIYSIPAWGFPHTTIVSWQAKNKGKRVFAKGKKKFLSFLFCLSREFLKGLTRCKNSTLREDCWRKFSISLTQFSPLLQFPWRKKAGTRRWKSKVFLKLKSSQDGYQERVGNLVIFEMRAKKGSNNDLMEFCDSRHCQRWARAWADWIELKSTSRFAR